MSNLLIHKQAHFPMLSVFDMCLFFFFLIVKTGIKRFLNEHWVSVFNFTEVMESLQV